MNTVHIFDIDTTIANNQARASLLKKTCLVCLTPKPRDKRAECPSCNRLTEDKADQASWDLFFDPELVIKDIAEPKALMYANKLRAAGAPVHFLTGRSEVCREVTLLWLRTKFNMQPGEELIMRSDQEEGLVASEYKSRAWHRLSVEKGYGKFLPYFYEDDPHVLDMYGSRGIVVQCPEAWDYLVPDVSVGVEKAWTIL